MDKIELQKLRDLSCERVAERLGLTVRHHRTLCPFHDDHTPSMSLKGSHYRCWSCGAHGGTIDLAMHVLGKDFPDACRWLADEAGVILAPAPLNPPFRGKGAAPISPLKEEPEGAPRPFDPSRYERYFQHPYLSDVARRFLFDERRLHPAVIRFCRLNSYRDWLQIPYYDRQGRLIGIQRRYMGNDPAMPRFRFMQGERTSLYNQQVIPMLRPGDDLYLGEGPSDVWALLSSGRKAIGIPSATLLMPEDLKTLSSLSSSLSLTFHIYPDRDEAGEKLFLRLLTASIEGSFPLVRHDLPEGCKDFSDYWLRGPRCARSEE